MSITFRTNINVDTKFGYTKTNQCPFGIKEENNISRHIYIDIDRIVYLDNKTKMDVIFHSGGIYDKIAVYLFFEDNTASVLVGDLKKSNDTSDILIEFDKLGITKKVKYISLRDVNSPIFSATVAC